MIARFCLIFSLIGATQILGTVQASEHSVPLSWQTICEVSPCRYTAGVRNAGISPDGSVVVVTARTTEHEGIFLIPVDGGEARFWIEGASPVWFSDSDRIVFSRDNDLWVVKRGSTRPIRVTEDEDDERASRPSPDGKSIAFLSGRSGHQDIWLVAAEGSSDPVRITKESMPADQFGFTFSWSPDGNKIAYYSNKSSYWEDDLWIVDVASKKERQLSKAVMGRSRPAWSPDGSRIAIMGTAKSGFWYSDLLDIYMVDANTGAEQLVPMQVYATGRGAITWSGNGSELFFPYLERAETELWRVSAAGGVATRVTNIGGSFRSYDATPGGDAFVFARSTATRGTEVDYVTRLGGGVTRLTHFANDWEGLVEPEEVSFRSWDGLYIQGLLYLPPDFDKSGNYPALVQVHGGGTNTYSNGLNLVEQYLAQLGYVVLAVNYRGGSGFGREYQDLAVNDWANGQSRDAASAADFIRAQPWSTGKVGIYGYSYGGIASMGAITRVPDAFDAAVPMAGIYDFADAYVTADRIGRLFTREGHGGSPEERPEIYAISNSIARIENIKTPVLIMHGEADVRAPFRQFGLAVAALKRYDKEFESHSFPNEPHGFRNAANRIDMYQRLEAWFDRWLK